MLAWSGVAVVSTVLEIMLAKVKKITGLKDLEVGSRWQMLGEAVQPPVRLRCRDAPYT